MGLERVAAWSQRHHSLAIGLWVAVLAGVTALSQAVGDDYQDEHTLPGTESQLLSDTLEDAARGTETRIRILGLASSSPK